MAYNRRNSSFSHADRGRAQDDVGLMGETDLRSSGEKGTVNEACVKERAFQIIAATGRGNCSVKVVRLASTCSQGWTEHRGFPVETGEGTAQSSCAVTVKAYRWHALSR